MKIVSCVKSSSKTPPKCHTFADSVSERTIVYSIVKLIRPCARATQFMHRDRRGHTAHKNELTKTSEGRVKKKSK